MNATRHAQKNPSTDDADADRPEDCTCLPSFDDGDLGCFACWLAGFETANPDAEEGDDQ